jgi:hypothetical protein
MNCSGLHSRIKYEIYGRYISLYYYPFRRLSLSTPMSLTHLALGYLTVLAVMTAGSLIYLARLFRTKP